MTGERHPETLDEKIARLVREDVAIVTYDPEWPGMYERERDRILGLLPPGLIARMEHFGGTAVPGMRAKPVIDILAGVGSLEEAKKIIVPILEGHGYEYLWRPTRGEDGPPFYAWFIGRDAKGARASHVHVVEPGFEHWDGLYFRDYLIGHPGAAKEYDELKARLAEKFPNDRAAYTNGKTEFITRVTGIAKDLYRSRDGRAR